MELSKRLQAVADMVSEGLIVADVGTDHGYIPIYLVQTKKAPKAIAMDVNKGPLFRAENHIASYGLQSVIETRISDGVQSLKIGVCRDCRHGWRSHNQDFGRGKRDISKLKRVCTSATI